MDESDGNVRFHTCYGLIPAGAHMMSAWLVNDGCDFMMFV